MLNYKSFLQNKTTAIAITFAIGLAVSCQSKINIPDIIPDNLICFCSNAGEMRLTVDTKAAEITSLTSFNVLAVTGSAGSESSAWSEPTAFYLVPESEPATYAADKYWPSIDPEYKFYGSSLQLNYSADGTYVNATNATDVVCAYNNSPTYKTRNNLTFEHIFARLSTFTVQADDYYDISDITVWIANVKTGGNYNLRTQAWSSLTPGSSSETELLRYTGTLMPNESYQSANHNIYLVPKEYEIRISWTAHVNDYTQTFTRHSASVELAPGKVNSVSCTLSGNEIRIAVSSSDGIGWKTPIRTSDATGFNNGAGSSDGNEWNSSGGSTDKYNWTNGAGSKDAMSFGLFSVSDNKRVIFAPGNLQAVIGSGPTNTYNYTASSWKFAEHQYDFIGNAAGNNSFAVGTTVDLFGWVDASASYDSYGLCTNTSRANAYYGTSASDALKTDWGSIPGVVSSCGSGWHTLTSTEWNYLFTQRANASSLYGQCQITTASGTVTGMLILPDNWTRPSNCTVTPGTGAYDRVTYSATAASGASNAWCDMEAAGAVFLPAAGNRRGVDVTRVGDDGSYWSSSVISENAAYDLNFYSGRLTPQRGDLRYQGFSVRLVCDVN